MHVMHVRDPMTLTNLSLFADPTYTGGFVKLFSDMKLASSSFFSHSHTGDSYVNVR